MGVLRDSERLEKELTPEPVMIPATGAAILHTALVGEFSSTHCSQASSTTAHGAMLTPAPR